MGGGGGGGGEKEIIYLSLHCHHQNDFCIKMGSDESHVSVGSDGQSHKTVSTNDNLFAENGEPEWYRTEVLPLTSLTPYRCCWGSLLTTPFQTRTLYTGNDIYRSTISEWRRQSKSAGLWQYQTFRRGPVLDCQLCAMREKNFCCCFCFFRALRSFWWCHMRHVSLEWRTDWIDFEPSLWTPCSWLRRNVKKPKQKTVVSAASSRR